MRAVSFAKAENIAVCLIDTVCVQVPVTKTMADGEDAM